MTTLSDVLDQMISAGMPEIPERLELSGKLRRFGRKKRGWYRLHENTARSGRSYVTGAFGYWGLVDGTRVAPAGTFDAAEREEFRRQARERADAEAVQRRLAAERAAMQSAERWRGAARSGGSLYLRRKGIDQADSVRFESDGVVLVPMIRYDLPRERAMVGVQAIRPDGAKRFARGTAKLGSACRLGCVVVGEPILICEGYATGMTLRMATGRRLPVFVAFDAGNLQPVAGIVRDLHGACPIVLCADDDWRTTGNPGRAKARAAARCIPNAHVAYPVWPSERADRDTDFNDLHMTAGLHVVARQLRAGLALIGYSMEDAARAAA